MSGMVEKVARAMRTHEVVGFADAESCHSWYRVMAGNVAFGGDHDTLEEAQSACDLLNARAALSALRDAPASLFAEVLPKVGNPSLRQQEIGSEAATICDPWDARGKLVASEMVRDWQAMIDAALAE